ncbi:MAG: hypothetical protein NZ941_07585 [Candidatus Caldarchaeum sp.]|nr:hypothetical protein [Candidatus Caldarchaeum sp.]
MADEERDYWVIKIPKPRRIIRVFAKVSRSFGGVFHKTFSIDVPLIFLISLLIAFVLFLSFTIVFRSPDLVAASFTVLLVGLYLLVLWREIRR